MAIKDKNMREHQIAFYRDAVVKRRAFLQTRKNDSAEIEKDPILRHLRAELSRLRKRLLAATKKPKPAPTKEPAKTEEAPKKKQKPKKAAAE